MWVLIVITAISYGGGVTTHTFHSKASCEKAMALLKAESGFVQRILAFCVEDKTK